MSYQSIAGLAEREGLFFLAKRKPGGALGNKWELPGGKVENGESPKEAMKREWMEELELEIKTGDLLSEGTFFHNTKEFLLQMYAVSFETDPEVFHEHVECGWFSASQIDNLDLADSDRIVLSQYLKDVRTH